MAESAQGLLPGCISNNRVSINVKGSDVIEIHALANRLERLSGAAITSSILPDCPLSVVDVSVMVPGPRGGVGVGTAVAVVPTPVGADVGTVVGPDVGCGLSEPLQDCRMTNRLTTIAIGVSFESMCD